MANTKKTIYILFTLVLTNILAFLVHALSEIVYINFLLSDFQSYSFGFSWGTWLLIHDGAVAVLHIAATVGGYELGRRWWWIVYVERRHWLFHRKV